MRRSPGMRTRTTIRLTLTTALCLVAVWLVGQIGHTAGFSRLTGLNGILSSVDGAIMDGLWIILNAPVRIFDAGLRDPAAWTTAIVTLAVGMTLLAVAVIINEQAVSAAASQPPDIRPTTPAEADEARAATAAQASSSGGAASRRQPEDARRQRPPAGAPSAPLSVKSPDSSANDGSAATARPPRPDQPKEHGPDEAARSGSSRAETGPPRPRAAVPGQPGAIVVSGDRPLTAERWVPEPSGSTDPEANHAARARWSDGSPRQGDTEFEPQYSPAVRALAVLGAALATSVAVWQIAWTLSRAEHVEPWPIPWSPDAILAWTELARTIAGLDVLAVLTAMVWLLFVVVIPVGRWLRLLASVTTAFALAAALLNGAITNGAVYGVLRDRPLQMTLSDPEASPVASPDDARLRLLLGPGEGASSVIVDANRAAGMAPTAYIVEATPRAPLLVAGRRSLYDFIVGTGAER